ncbi:MAG: hypothetical protein NWR72_21555 [Bacteroidia bacterium]|nr:hypothetical protein [Bacteroidia bacterium]
MAKLIKFHNSADYQDLVLGIAADIKSWKLCHEINEILGLQLKNIRDLPQTPPKWDSEPAQQTLDLDSRTFLQERYEDLSSHQALEYLFYSKDPHNLPLEARAFRFFLLIRTETGQLPEISRLLSSLKQSSLIHSVVDLSGAKNLQLLLP